MTYLRLDTVKQAIAQLKYLHPFFGITYLVCKRLAIPIGSAEPFPINNAEEEFLREYYRPNLASNFYFQPFKTSGTGRWLAPKYPYSGSQSTRTRGHFARAFIHKRNTDLWGWAPNYIGVLQEKLEQDRTGRIPAFWLAVWLYRNREWPTVAHPTNLIRTLLREFRITDEERDQLFQTSVPDLPIPFTTVEPFEDDALIRNYEPAPDAFPVEGGTLRELHLRNIGPAMKLDFEPAERLSIVTGDNGLGKTFLLECSWWSLTGEWAERTGDSVERPALPHESALPATISFVISRTNDYPASETTQFDRSKSRWPAPEDRPTIPGLIVYARVDGSFAVWDPARHGPEELGSRSFIFSRDAVLNGLSNKIEGLIRDWVRWQNAKDQGLFEMFSRVLGRLSPPDMAPLQPGEPIRIANDPRDIPTLQHDYGTVPFLNESAGVRRIVTIAYLLVWAWNEHRIHASQINKAPQPNMVIMIDEVEAHLHPKWQRVILPALLEVIGLLSKELKPQMMVATHSPLILASMESSFVDETDKLFHLHLLREESPSKPEVALDEVRYFKHGTVDAWLTSDIFELKQPRSREGETTLERAKRLLAQSSSDARQIGLVHAELQEVLPDDDPFWPRWLHFVEMKGVAI